MTNNPVDFAKANKDLVGFNSLVTTITAAQIKNSFSNSVVLVPGQPGKIIMPVIGIVLLNFIAPVYTVVGVTGSAITWPSFAPNAVMSLAPSFLAKNTSWINSFPLNMDAAAFIGEDIVFKTAGANPLAGNSTLSLNIWYAII